MYILKAHSEAKKSSLPQIGLPCGRLPGYVFLLFLQQAEQDPFTILRVVISLHQSCPVDPGEDLMKISP